MMKKKIMRGIAALGLLVLAGCAPIGLAASAGATAGVASAQDGGIRGAITDNTIRLQIIDFWFKKDLKMFQQLSVTVKEGRALLTGVLPTADMRVEAVRLAWQADGIRQVINEITVNESGEWSAPVTDRWISSSIKTQIILDKNVQSVNYNIETANGVVYVMGVAQDEQELERVLNYARNMRNVKKVVNYTRLRYQNPQDLGVTRPN